MQNLTIIDSIEISSTSHVKKFLRALIIHGVSNSKKEYGNFNVASFPGKVDIKIIRTAKIYAVGNLKVYSGVGNPLAG